MWPANLPVDREQTRRLAYTCIIHWYLVQSSLTSGIMTEVRVAVHFWMTVLENSELEERELPPLAVGPVVMGGVVKGLFQHEVKHNSIR